jgi:hypothetical protein
MFDIGSVQRILRVLVMEVDASYILKEWGYHIESETGPSKLYH